MINMLSKMDEFKSADFRVKETDLKSFLYRSPRTYDSFFIATLTEVFEVPKPQMLQLINRQIVKSKLQAHLDANSDYLIMDVERV